MSLISNTHNIVAYTTGVTKAYAGQRLSTVTYKTDKSTGVKPDSVCVSIPQVNNEEITPHMSEFLPHVKALIERTQDLIIRSIHESNRSTVSDAELSIASVLEYLNEENSASGRLTKKDAEEWFDLVIADPLALALASRLGVSEEPTQEQSDRIELLLRDFKANVGSLTAGNVKHAPDVCAVLKKAIAMAPPEDVIRVKMEARLDTMMKKVSVSIADAL